MATSPRLTTGPAQPSAFASSQSIERALSRFGWLGDPDDLLQKLGIDRTKLRAIEHDDEVSAALETRRAACANTPWRIEHPQARARTFLTDVLTPHIDNLMQAAWAALPYGYSVFEVVYQAPDDVRNRTPGRIGIAQVIECPFEWFRLLPDGKLIWRDDNTEAEPLRFIATAHAASLRKPMGDALLAKAYWPWFFRSHGWRMWAKFMESAATPLVYGKTQGEKQALVDLLRTVTSGPVMAVNDVDEVATLDTPGNSPNKFTEFETACQRRIQRLILGQTLTSGTDGGSGNRALGQVHNEVREEKKRSDVRMVSLTIQNVVERLCILNGMALGTFVMEDGTGLEMDRANRDKILVEAGMVRFTAEYVREKYGLEESDFIIPEIQQNTPPALESTAQPATKQIADTAPRGLVQLVDGSGHAPRPQFTADQQAIEDEVARTLPQLPSPIAHAAIASAIRQAKDANDLYERLSVALADADDRQFRQTFERALYAADIMGYGQAFKARPADARQIQQAAAPSVVHLSAPITVNMPEPQSAPAPVVHMAAPVVNIAPAEITVQAAPAPVVNMAPAAPTTVVVQAFPEQAVQTVETDADGNVTKTVTTYQNAPKE